MSGDVGILNVGAGDTKLSFDPTNPVEAIRAARIVKDMLRRGYVLLVRQPDGKHVRALDFDENTHEYIIADLDSPPEKPHAEVEEPKKAEPQPASEPPKANVPPTRNGLDDGVPLSSPPVKPRGRKRVAAATASAVAVSRTAGG